MQLQRQRETKAGNPRLDRCAFITQRELPDHGDRVETNETLDLCQEFQKGNVVTMNKKQRKRVEQGVDAIATEDKSLKTVLRSRSGPGIFARCLLMLPAVCRGITPACQPDSDYAHVDSLSMIDSDR